MLVVGDVLRHKLGSGANGWSNAGVWTMLVRCFVFVADAVCLYASVQVLQWWLSSSSSEPTPTAHADTLNALILALEAEAQWLMHWVSSHPVGLKLCLPLAKFFVATFLYTIRLWTHFLRLLATAMLWVVQLPLAQWLALVLGLSGTLALCADTVAALVPWHVFSFYSTFRFLYRGQIAVIKSVSLIFMGENTLCVCMCMCVCVCLFMCVCQHLPPPSICMLVCVCVCLSVSLCLSLCLSPSPLSLSVSLSLSLPLSLSLSLCKP